MKNIRTELGHWLQVITFVLILGGVSYSSSAGITLTTATLWKLPDVVGLYALAHLVFVKWLWKLPWLQGWLIPFPNITGSWNGTIVSSWVNPETGLRPDPIPCTVVIRQTFDEISVAIHTPESSSYSTAAAVSCDENSHRKTVSYLYTNRPKASIRERSAVHDGAAVLDVLAASPRALRGEYWTGRGTRGDIDVTFVSRKCLDRFSPSRTASGEAGVS
jgi:hypothetical protein